MLTKYRGGQLTYLEFCDKEVRKVIQAPPQIQESILNPLHRPDRKDRHPGQGARRYPSNPNNTLRGVPTLGPVALFRVGQICNRCEKANKVHGDLRLRPVTNLDKIYWEGLPVQGPTEERIAFLCHGCVFPACPRNQSNQDLEYRHGLFQATEDTRELPDPAISEVAESVEPTRESEWGDSSDDSEFIPYNRRRKSPSGSTRQPLCTPLRSEKGGRNVQFETPIADTGGGKAWSTSTGYTMDKGVSTLDRMKMMDAKYKVKSNIDKTWTAMVPMFAGKHGDIKALAGFNIAVRDALRRESLFEDCIDAGIPLSELLHRLLVLRLEPSSVVMSHLKPVWINEDWRSKHFATQEGMMRFLIRHLLDKTALCDAELAFTSFRRHPGETGIDLVIRLREVYETASLADDFPERIPEHMLPERLVRSLDKLLQIRVTDGLNKSCRPWRRDKLERENRTSSDQVRMILTKIQQEIDTQLSMWPADKPYRPGTVAFRATSPAKLRPRWGRPTPPPNRSETAYAMQEEGGEIEEEQGMSDEETDQLRAIGDLPHRTPTPSRPPVGLLGPAVPAQSRFPRGPLGPRSPIPNGRQRPPLDDAQKGRFTLGNPNYSGCHNCGDKQHMSRDCTLPLSQKLAALVGSHTGWPAEDVESLLSQGFPAALEECWDDPEEIRQYCLALTEWRQAAGAARCSKD